ncbi:hypothetical protein Ancab_014930 [Ancistrocladus abbreviatus]
MAHRFSNAAPEVCPALQGRRSEGRSAWSRRAGGTRRYYCKDLVEFLNCQGIKWVVGDICRGMATRAIGAACGDFQPAVRGGAPWSVGEAHGKFKIMLEACFLSSTPVTADKRR